MKTYSEFLAVGQPMRLAVGGKVLYVQRSEAGQVLNIEFFRGAASQSVERVGKGFKAAPVNGFDSIRITAAVAGTVDFVVTDGEIDVKFDDAKTIIGNDDSEALPIRLQAGARMAVDIAGGNVQLTATNVEINNTDAKPLPVRAVPLKTLMHAEPVAIQAGAAQGLSNDAGLKRLRFRNASDNGAMVALGGEDVTMHNAVILLAPGDIWTEDEAAGAAWYATSDMNAASVAVMGVKE